LTFCIDVLLWYCMTVIDPNVIFGGYCDYSMVFNVVDWFYCYGPVMTVDDWNSIIHSLMMTVDKLMILIRDDVLFSIRCLLHWPLLLIRSLLILLTVMTVLILGVTITNQCRYDDHVFQYWPIGYWRIGHWPWPTFWYSRCCCGYSYWLFDGGIRCPAGIRYCVWLFGYSVLTDGIQCYCWLSVMVLFIDTDDIRTFIDECNILLLMTPSLLCCYYNDLGIDLLLIVIIVHWWWCCWLLLLMTDDCLILILLLLNPIIGSNWLLKYCYVIVYYCVIDWHCHW